MKVTNAWMESFRAEPDGAHVVTNPRTGRAYRIPRDIDILGYSIHDLVPAEAAADSGRAFYTRRDLWRIIIRNAWQTGEPGVVFIDRINEHNPTPHIGRMEATNPCGEQPLLDYEACNLGSINLAHFILHPGTPQAKVNWDALGSSVDECVRFLDNVIDVNTYPLPQIDRICKANRKIGLGVMGFADALYMLGVGYNTDQGVEWGRTFMRFVNDRAHEYSSQLALERGSFPNWKGSTWDTQHHRPMRNACCTTVAPTGTISILAACSCGIEPLFALVFKRNVLKEERQRSQPMIEVNPVFAQAAGALGLDGDEWMEQIAREGSLAHIQGLPDELRRVFVTAHDIEPEWHVRMQAAFQEHCDSSISKTINFPASATEADVETIYQMSYDLRCKGVTVYRDGCRSEQPMALDRQDGQRQPQADPEPTATADRSTPVVPRDMPEVTSSLRMRQMTPFGNMHVHITVDPRTERELEVFAQLGKGGDLAYSDLEAICRMVSLWLRSGGSLRHVIQQLQGIGSSLQVATKDGRIMSLPDGLARALIKYSYAKTRFGLKDLLLGNYSLDDMGATLRGEAPVPEPGKGNGNGHNGGAKPNGNGEKTKGLASRNARPGETFAAPSPGLRQSPRLNQEELFKTVCPVCGGLIRYAEGCRRCANDTCGWAQC